MEFLEQLLLRDGNYNTLLRAVNGQKLPAAATGLARIHKALVLSALRRHTDRRLLVLAPDEAGANALCADLCSLGLRALQLPARDYNLSGYSASREYEQARMDTLSSVLDGAFDALCVSADAAVQLTLPPAVLRESRISLQVGATVDSAALCAQLTAAGYTRCESVDGKGQFAVRGGIVDIFAPNLPEPVRLELWGDEIDSLAYFDLATQRRGESAERVVLCPAREPVYAAADLAERLAQYGKSKKPTDRQRAVIEADAAALRDGLEIAVDRYLPLLYDSCGTVFDYAADCLTAVCETGNFYERLKSLAVLQAEDVKSALEAGFLSWKTTALWLTEPQITARLTAAVYLENFPRSVYKTKLAELVHFDYKRSSAWSGDTAALCEDLSYIRAQNGTAVILAGEERAARVLRDQLLRDGFAATAVPALPGDLQPGIWVSVGGLSDGFELPGQRFLLITHRTVFADRKLSRRRPKNAKEIGSLDELQRGDYVVHTAHGIGIFDGINRITNDGVTKDYIKIKYRGTDVLYVPVTQLDLVSKYVGAAAEEGNIRLNRLGSPEWQNTRARVRRAVRDMAKQLTALYAKRMATKGYAFSPDTDLQNNFERRFEYDETPDQLRCTAEIKADMERAVPMDRLLCGDVGFGKTEVALRAAFKCVAEGRQCAFLVPTTILAMQHYQTILRRMGDLPVEVRLLSRFVSPTQQQRTVKDLRAGAADLVVGTHRLISKDVQFKDLGLVIIDEEQRFGVAQKEALKQRYPAVDILTLSATPIPRTLNMALSGLRDMSTVEEAPGDRHPVQTYVLEQNDAVLADAIAKELRRGGQVYYLHNRVESIESCAMRLKQRLPQARISVAHGKMSEEQLGEIWRQLVEHEIDVLVCTTIIETGVDVPNVNTLIIENADRFGLSQLHQLRGRVGRSPRRAYAFFCFARGRQLSEVAQKRLEAIRQFTEFGAGFKIAMRDMEIRGAGSILGGEQHGNMEAVGYDMYLKLLADAIAGEKSPADAPALPEVTCTVDLNISAHIPERYIESLSARLGIYKRIADIRTDADTADVVDELCDRFGEPPAAVMGLIEIALLRNKADAAGIHEITGTADSVLLHTAAVRPDVLTRLSEAFGNRFVLTADRTACYRIRCQKGEKTADLVGKIVRVL